METSFLRSKLAIGIMLPIFIEFAIFQTYLFFMPARQPTLDIIFPIFLFASPIALFYVKMPNIIFRTTRLGHKYSIVLKENIWQLLSQKKLSIDENEKIELALRAKLIPRLIKQLKQSYLESFFKYRRSEVESLLSFHERVFMFGFTSLLLNIVNFIGIIYLHFHSLDLWFLVIDRITAIDNVLIFLFVFGLLILFSVIMIAIATRGIIRVAPKTLPLLARFEDDLTQEERLERIRAFSNLPAIIPQTIKNNEMAMLKVFEQTIFSDVIETVELFIREKTGKQLAWNQYSTVLDELNLPNEEKKELENQYMQSPLLKVAEKISFDPEQFKSISDDFNYVRSRIDRWEQLDKAEKGMAFLFLYRNAETLTRNLLRRFQLQPSDWTLYLMLKTLLDANIINDHEFGLIDAFRRKRNFFLHASGEDINISKNELKNVIEALEAILLRVEKKL